MEYVATKTVREIVNATFPDYRKHKVAVQISTQVTMRDLNWSGGTRAEYRACTLDGKALDTRVDMSMPAPWENPYEGLTLNIPPGMVIVKGGHFCGKKAMLYITANPGNLDDNVKALFETKLLIGDK